MQRHKITIHVCQILAVSERRACQVLGQARSTQRRVHEISGEEARLVADITYIRIRSVFVYLAAILDAYSRRVIGYAISTGLDAPLTLKALRMAIAGRQLDSGVIHHSDQGVQSIHTISMTV